VKVMCICAQLPQSPLFGFKYALLAGFDRSEAAVTWRGRKCL